ncbi:uncharacterized protein A1O9_03363 [Exophiala aquamarina CBS 119918]|uniref:NmrA-like domain-containing protein n=1 Tax=Exophiala aquamarina CBS 119918 TaxID=1182545 RepID=A0A072PR65_9EURO|nr:uncharacterized protein A1O9_03363 [Exophiala aquamarina CBS 119918]KEF61793.1 hypothetical protein A1O9_03363 [Exophiala aquamarina CBS 119918]
MASSGTKVAVVGPNGILGAPVIKQLLASGFALTLITRDATKTAQKLSSNISADARAKVKIEEVDFSSAKSLAPVLRGHDSVVVLTGRDELEPQKQVIDAAIEAGVEQIIPSSFGVDSTIPEIRALPSIAVKIKMEDYLLSKISSPDTSTSYTIIQTGLFLDWALGVGMLVNILGKGDQPTMLFDNGDVKLSTTHVDDIARAVATAVEHRKDEKFKNKMLFTNTFAGTQNDFIACAKELEPGKPWPMIKVDTAAAKRKSEEALERGDTSPEAMRGFIVRSSFGDGLGLFSNVDNELLGVKERDTAYLKELLAEFLRRE